MLPTQNPPAATFSLPPQAVEVDSWDLADLATVRAVVALYIDTGYAVVQCPPDPGRPELSILARRLNLGEPFTPPLYRGSGHTGDDGVSALTAVAGTSAHPFQSRDGQNLHCDGTLQSLGQILTTVMLCVRPAASGGATILFDAATAFGELCASDPEAAKQLTHPGALMRTSTLAAGHATAGPAFAWRESRVITRYSVTATDTYHPRQPNEEPALRRALRFLTGAARPGSPHRCEFTLRAGQCLVLANGRVCHGRTAYRDEPGSARLLLRSLFTRRPTSSVENSVR